MGFASIRSAIEADLVLHLSAPLSAVTFHVGGRELNGLVAPPRIVWVRLPGTFMTSVQSGNPRAQPRRLKTHVAAIAAHVWADKSSAGDDSDTELLAHQLVASVYRVTHGSFELVGDDWDQPDWLTQGFLCTVGFRFHIPIVDAPTPTAGTTTRPPPQTFSDDTSEAPPTGTLQAPGDS